MPSASHTQFELKINKSKGPNMQWITSDEAQTPAIAPICTTKLQQSKNKQTVIEDKIEGLKEEKKSDNWKRWQKN